MEPDITIQELWQSKEGRSHRFGGDVRALCRHLMEHQEAGSSDCPLVLNLAASRAQHEERIAKLPPPVPGEVLLPDDPIIAELREIRASHRLERKEHQSILREEPPEYGETKE